MATDAPLVLVVDDETAVRGVAARVLGRLGYTVREAVDGPSALEVARSADEDIALLLTDVVMPGMKGPELARTLRLEHPEMRVVFMSGFDEDELASLGIDVGGAYISKPFTVRVLTLMVEGALVR